jgi:hypothetical protein
VECVSHMTLDRFRSESIFAKVGMVDTFFKVPSEERSRLVTAYLPRNDGIDKLEDAVETG